jgi:CBS domain-containing protein
MGQVPTVRECMSSNAFAVEAGLDVYRAIEELIRRKISCAPVVDEEGQVVGLLAETDCLRVVSSFVWGELAFGSVDDYMSTPPTCLRPDLDLFSAVQVFTATHVAALPVVEDGALIGTIGRQNVLGGILKFQAHMSSMKDHEVEDLRAMQHPESIQEFQRLAGSQTREQLAEVLHGRHRPGRS